MADKVLIVEDEEVVRELLEGWLEDAGYETLASPDGLDGLRKLYSFRPDLVVADVLMPNMDGFELCRLAREVCDAPIMILSGLGKEEDSAKGQRTQPGRRRLRGEARAYGRVPGQSCSAPPSTRA